MSAPRLIIARCGHLASTASTGTLCTRCASGEFKAWGKHALLCAGYGSPTNPYGSPRLRVMDESEAPDDAALCSYVYNSLARELYRLSFIVVPEDEDGTKWSPYQAEYLPAAPENPSGPGAWSALVRLCERSKSTSVSGWKDLMERTKRRDGRPSQLVVLVSLLVAGRELTP